MKKLIKQLSFVIGLSVLLLSNAFAKDKAVESFDTGLTIQKVRSAKFNKTNVVIGSSYEGIIMASSYQGETLWETPLSGFMVHDLWCSDIDGDGSDEVMVANADGMLYCLNSKGVIVWTFEPVQEGINPPMYSVCTLNAGNKKYVVCGGLDHSFYYLDSNGKLVTTVSSHAYSDFKVPDDFKDLLAQPAHNVNFLRPMPTGSGTDHLILLATNNHMQNAGIFYFFEPLQTEPYKHYSANIPKVCGDFRVVDPLQNGEIEFVMGSSSIDKSLAISTMSSKTGKGRVFPLKKLGQSGYRVAQPMILGAGAKYEYLIVCGNHILIVGSDLKEESLEKIETTYAPYDAWMDEQGFLLLASAQSGGSEVHVLNTNHPNWKNEFASIKSIGKTASMLHETKKLRAHLQNYKQPQWQRPTLPVYLTWANLDDKSTQPLIQDIQRNYQSPIFLTSDNSSKVENWDRAVLESEIFINKRDKRHQYVRTQEEILKGKQKTFFNTKYGISYWVGHGNDPYMYNPETTKKVLEMSNGKKTVLILPELEHSLGDYSYVIHNLIDPMAEQCDAHNGNIFIRGKNIFWQSTVYHDEWSDFIRGKYASAIVPSMEETTDKTMELSLVGRMGLWASGAVDNWGMRCSRDNPCFDRQRQHGYMRLPNHFLRHMVFRLACGATYLNNTYVDQEYLSLAWELVAKGALFVPKRDEIVSFSPVHVSMKQEPSERYHLYGAEQSKWTVFFDRDDEANHPMVFSRANGAWPAAPNTIWDFSSYAAGVKDRRQNFIPPYNNGIVLITPVQHGVFAQKEVQRAPLEQNLHPIYKNILKEYITDGEFYYSADGTMRYAADEYYKTIKSDIEKSASLLPVTVKGEVGWVCAQVSPTHLRLTLVDGGYLNPSEKEVKVVFNTIQPLSISDVLTGESFKLHIGEINVTVPLGLFKFIDIELNQSLK